jgi:hypothetical protein
LRHFPNSDNFAAVRSTEQICSAICAHWQSIALLLLSNLLDPAGKLMASQAYTFVIKYS